MDYAYLTDNDRETLRRQRILQLESDHYRLELLIAETSDPGRCAELVSQQAVLQQAITVHCGESEEATVQDEVPIDSD